MIKQDDVIKVLDILEETYPDAECALNHKNVYELIVSGSFRCPGLNP